MKIQSVKINGIRGFSYWEDDQSLENPHAIVMDSKHFLLYGENGTGKSSFFDAIEWCLTGENPEIKNRSLDSSDGFLKNHFCPANAVASVEISFGSEPPIKRETRRGNLDVEYIADAVNHFIETSRIEQFVIDTRKKLWDRFLKLLGLDELIVEREQLLALKNESEKEQKRIKADYDSSNERTENNKNELAKIEISLKESFGENWLDILNSNDTQNSGIQNKYDELVKLRNYIKSFVEKKNKKKDFEAELQKIEQSIQQEKLSMDSADTSKIISEAYNYFQGNIAITECPVCGENRDYQTVLERLKNLKERFKTIIDLETAEKSIKNEINNLDLVSTEKTIIKIWHTYFNNNNTPLNIIIDSTEEIDVEIKKNSDTRKFELIGEYKAKQKDIEETKGILKNKKLDLDIYEQILRDIKQSFKSYKVAYTRKIKDELSKISKDSVTKIYLELNKTDNENIEAFDIEPDIINEEIQFKAKIKGRDEWIDAIPVLSTGHLRCLGFALLITRIKHGESKLKFIAIDDPIYAIDHEHRYDLIQYLKKLGNDYQLIITSSDRNFFDIFKNSISEQKLRAYQTHYTASTSTELGKFGLKKSLNNYIEEAKKHLNHNDFRAASLYTRLGLEFVLYDIAKNVNHKIPIDMAEKIGIKTFYSTKLKSSVINKHPALKIEIEAAFQQIESHRYFESLYKGFPLDALNHFPNDKRGFIYSKNEINEVVEVVLAFQDFIQNLTSSQ